MIEAYCELHRMGFAHSVEAWKDGKLAGGLYGVSLGKCFFGESMFTREPNASKFALIELTRVLKERGFHFIDSQVHTPHLESLGAEEISRKKYLQLLEKALTDMEETTWVGNWGNSPQPANAIVASQ